MHGVARSMMTPRRMVTRSAAVMPDDAMMCGAVMNGSPIIVVQARPGRRNERRKIGGRLGRWRRRLRDCLIGDRLVRRRLLGTQRRCQEQKCKAAKDYAPHDGLPLLEALRLQGGE